MNTLKNRAIIPGYALRQQAVKPIAMQVLVYTIKLSVVFFIVLFSIGALPAQDVSKIPGIKKDLVTATNDSDRVDALASLCFHYSNLNFDTSIAFGEQAMQLADKINYLKGKADSYNNLGWTYYISADLHKAENYFKTSLELFRKTGIKKYIKIPLANLGTLYMDQTEYAKSLECLMQVLRYDDEINDNEVNTQVNKGVTLHEVGRLYNLMKKPEDARKYFQQALEVSRQANSDINIGENLMSIGNTYLSEKEQPIALKYYSESLKYLQRPNDRYRIGLLHENMGNSYVKLKQYDESVRQYKMARDFYQLLNSKADMFFVCIGLAEVYNELKDSTSGITVLNEALRYATELKNKNFQQQAILGLSDFYKTHRNFKKAYEYLDSSYKIKDSLFTQQKQEESIKLQTQFETERKEKQIELLQKNQQLNLSSLQRHKVFQYAACIIIFLLLLIGFLVINRYRSVQRAKRLTEIAQMRNNIARDLHDDIGSTLTSINILSKVALQQASQTNGAVPNIQKIKERSSDIMDRMNDIVWAISPANDALDKIILRMKEFANELCEQSDIRCEFTEPAGISNLFLPLKQRSDLYLIFKEAINNSVKHSGADTVRVAITNENQVLSFYIEDDGHGFDPAQVFAGHGLKNMQSRAKEIDADLSIHPAPGGGTSIVLKISLT